MLIRPRPKNFEFWILVELIFWLSIQKNKNNLFTSEIRFCIEKDPEQFFFFDFKASKVGFPTDQFLVEV